MAGLRRQQQPAEKTRTRRKTPGWEPRQGQTAAAREEGLIEQHKETPQEQRYRMFTERCFSFHSFNLTG